jgi:hypothetical protein
VVVRSGLFATQVLKAFWAATRVPDILVEVLGRALALQRDERRYWEIGRDLMRFSQIALLIPAERHDQHLISYYDSIKNLNGCANNQFWIFVELSGRFLMLKG